MRLGTRVSGHEMARHLLLGAVVCCVGLPASARGQPLELTHSWVRSFPGTTGAHSYANGVAVLDSTNLSHRGTVVVAGYATSEVMTLSIVPTQYRGFVAFVPPTGAPADGWVRNFVDGAQPGTGQAACTGVTVADRKIFDSRTAFVSGWFSGDVNFGSGIVHTATNGKDGFLARMDQTGPNAGTTTWVTPINGTGDAEVLATSSSARPASQCCGYVEGGVRYVTNDVFCEGVSIGGFFKDTINLGTQTFTTTPTTDEDGFVAFVHTLYNGNCNQAAGTVRYGFAINGPGSTRVLGVQMDQVDQRILVVGYYSSATTDFDPSPTNAVYPPNYQGGTDIFVARYCLPSSGNTPYLDWLFTTGTSGNDGATAAGADIVGHVYATGWKAGQGGTRDIWVAKIEQPINSFCTGETTTTCAWDGRGGRPGLRRQRRRCRSGPRRGRH